MCAPCAHAMVSTQKSLHPQSFCALVRPILEAD